MNNHTIRLIPLFMCSLFLSQMAGSPLVGVVHAQPGVITTTYICSKDLVVDPKSIRGQTQLVEPSGELSTVNVEKGLEAREKLLYGSKKARDAAIKSILETPQLYPPPAFFYLAQVLWRDGNREDALFWLYAGQLRARFDVARSGESAAHELVTILSETYGAGITDALSDDVALARTIVQRTLEWDKKTAHDYDLRWVNIHAVTSYLAAPGSELPSAASTAAPKEQWSTIAEQTRKQFLQEFEQVAAKLTSQDQAPDDDQD